MDNWKNILDEDILKTNINFVAVFVMNYECLKEFVIERIRDFYSEHFYMDGERIVCEESSTYKEKVAIFDKAISYSAEEDAINSITIIELKRPQRDDLTADDKNPLNQVLRYVSDIKAGKVKKQTVEVLEMYKTRHSIVMLLQI